ncbi:MAG: hypothetical protein AAGJ93_02235 [Bacteroidota bacterium]
MKREQHLNHPGLEPLWQSLEKEWFIQLIALIALVTGGLVVIAVALKGYLTMMGIGLIITGTGGFYLRRHLLEPSALDALLKMLYENPGEIVWIYSMVNDHHPFGLQFFQRGILYFKLLNGDEITANLPPKKLKLISKVLSRSLPDTVFGYSNERARKYLSDPASFKRV